MDKVFSVVEVHFLGKFYDKKLEEKKKNVFSPLSMTHQRRNVLVTMSIMIFLSFKLQCALSRDRMHLAGPLILQIKTKALFANLLLFHLPAKPNKRAL